MIIVSIFQFKKILDKIHQHFVVYYDMASILVSFNEYTFLPAYSLHPGNLVSKSSLSLILKDFLFWWGWVGGYICVAFIFCL